jgi:hypothetical protein
MPTYYKDMNIFTYDQALLALQALNDIRGLSRLVRNLLFNLVIKDLELCTAPQSLLLGIIVKISPELRTLVIVGMACASSVLPVVAHLAHKIELLCIPLLCFHVAELNYLGTMHNLRVLDLRSPPNVDHQCVAGVPMRKPLPWALPNLTVLSVDAWLFDWHFLCHCDLPAVDTLVISRNTIQGEDWHNVIHFLQTHPLQRVCQHAIHIASIC